MKEKELVLARHHSQKAIVLGVVSQDGHIHEVSQEVANRFVVG